MERRRIVIRKSGGPKVLQVETDELGPVAPGQVRVDCSFSGINWADLMMRVGLYPEAPKPPFTPGYEVSGKVVAVGEGVKGLRKGQKVAAGTKFGGYTSVIDVPQQNIVKLPAAISLETAAAMPVTHLTAWAALVGHARIRPGDKVLVHGGAGGVGLAAIALAKRYGAEVFATVGSTEKIEFLENEMGVSRAWNGRTEHWRHNVLSEAGPMDVVLDAIGGKHLHESRRCLAPFGKVIAYGLQDSVSNGKRNIPRTLAALRHMKVSAVNLMHRNVSVAGINMLPLQDTAKQELTDALASMAKDMALRRMPQPRIHKVFDLEDAPAAHEELASRRSIGKILLRC